MVQAAVGRTVAQWFWGPFGAFDNGNTLPITSVEFVPAEPGPSGCEPASDPTCSVYDGSSGMFRAHFDADADGDGVLTPFDDFPLSDNAKHSDADGIPDGCDPCPFTVLNDEDGDGVCELDQAYEPLDNCPITRNADQRNANLLAETQGLPKNQAPNAIYGDACDPIPVARLQPLPHADGVESDGVVCGTYYGDRVRLQPMGSHEPELGKAPGDLPEDGKYLIWPTLPDPDPGVLVAGEPGLLPGLPGVVLPGLDGTWGLLGEDGRLYASAQLGPALQARLASPAFVWVNAAEPSPFVGRGPAFPVALALEPDGSRVVDHVEVAGGKLLSAFDRGLTEVETPLGSPHALGHVAVLSRRRGGVFVLGGFDPESGEPTREVWYAPLFAPKWLVLEFSVRPEHVLAATYSADTGELVVLDELDGDARLSVLGVDSGESRELGRWPRHTDHWDHVWLTLDDDGSLLLTSSSRAAKEHVVSRLWLEPGEEPAVLGRRFRDKALALPPLRPEPPKPPKPAKPGKPPKVKKKPRAELVFRPKLHLHDACWAELGEQL